ncbi:MAG: helix-turn-helix transcriptional regulator [Pseudomonadaceae bacterium]|nr:helix-turn-helix transcriptional regulator [Pseudomonadaceae bacterium]
MNLSEMSVAAIAEELGERLKQARLNQNMTQAEVAEVVGISRRQVMNAEKGKAQLEVFVAILVALNLTSHLEIFLPKQQISPIQLARLQGRQRQRASGQKKSDEEDKSEW